MAYFLCVCVYCPHSLSIFGGGDRIRCTGDPGPILYGAVFTGPFLILKIPFQQLRWIYIFSNARGGGKILLVPLGGSPVIHCSLTLILCWWGLQQLAALCTPGLEPSSHWVTSSTSTAVCHAVQCPDSVSR